MQLWQWTAGPGTHNKDPYGQFQIEQQEARSNQKVSGILKNKNSAQLKESLLLGKKQPNVSFDDDTKQVSALLSFMDSLVNGFCFDVQDIEDSDWQIFMRCFSLFLFFVFGVVCLWLHTIHDND